MPLATCVTFEIIFDLPTHHYKPIKAPLIHRLRELLHEGRLNENVALALCYIFLSTAPRAIIPVTYSQGCFN